MLSLFDEDEVFVFDEELLVVDDDDDDEVEESGLSGLFESSSGRIVSMEEDGLSVNPERLEYIDT